MKTKKELGAEMGYREHLLVPGEGIDAKVWKFKNHYIEAYIGMTPTRIKIPGRMVIRWFKNAKKHAGLHVPGLFYRVYSEAPFDMVIVAQTIKADWK